jgi:pyridinium-3,5-bisthiocarboxylic acid mononucleotide nickel chelatase
MSSVSQSSGETTQIMEVSPLWLVDSVTQLECNLDDTTGELLADVIEVLLDQGAVDAWASPIVMKKGRPAHCLHCLCHSDDESKILEVFFRHTTTLGVRINREIPRAKLCRSFQVAQTPYRDNPRDGKVSVKVSSFQTGEIVSVKPEFDHCRGISRASGVPLKMVSEAALSDIRTRILDSDAFAP